MEDFTDYQPGGSKTVKVVVGVIVFLLVVGGLVAVILVRRQQLLTPVTDTPTVSEETGAAPVPSSSGSVGRTDTTAGTTRPRETSPLPPVVLGPDESRELTAEEKYDRGYPESWTVYLVVTDGGHDYHFLVTDRGNDQDADGLTDEQERSLGTDIHSRDTDLDNLQDKEEIEIYHTDPRLDDSDGDGRLDGAEVKDGTDPLQAD